MVGTPDEELRKSLEGTYRARREDRERSNEALATGRASPDPEPPPAPPPQPPPHDASIAGTARDRHLGRDIKRGIFVILVLAGIAWFFSDRPGGPVMPGHQAQLVNALKDARARYKAASSNQYLQDTIWNERERMLCDFVRTGGTSARDWIGRVKSVRDPWPFANDPPGTWADVQVEIGPDIVLETGGGSIAEKDRPDKTNIRKGTPLFNTVSTLRQGEAVVFSGQFVLRDDGERKGCLAPRGFTRQGRMDEPWMLFRFEQMARR